MDGVRAACTSGSSYCNEGLVAERFAAERVFILRNEHGLVFVAGNRLHCGECAVQFRRLSRREGVVILRHLRLEVGQWFLIHQQHLQGIDIRFEDRVCDGICILLTTLCGHVELTYKCALGQFNRVHRYCLPFVREVLIQHRECRSADRERIGVIETGRFETQQTISVGINHLERIGIRTGEAEDYGIGANACSGIFRLYGDDGLHLFGIRGIRQDGLYRLCFLRHHFRQFVGADRQFDLVEIEIRFKSRQTISVEVDHGEVCVR